MNARAAMQVSRKPTGRAPAFLPADWLDAGYAPAPGARGEYHGKFMVNRYILRGGGGLCRNMHLAATGMHFADHRRIGKPFAHE